MNVHTRNQHQHIRRHSKPETKKVLVFEVRVEGRRWDDTITGSWIEQHVLPRTSHGKILPILISVPPCGKEDCGVDVEMRTTVTNTQLRDHPQVKKPPRRQNNTPRSNLHFRLVVTRCHKMFSVSVLNHYLRVGLCWIGTVGVFFPISNIQTSNNL